MRKALLSLLLMQVRNFAGKQDSITSLGHYIKPRRGNRTEPLVEIHTNSMCETAYGNLN